ncbi:MAG: polysaccharide deacetylase [Frankiales bacterium]|nr:polysaccharide deacetylase [Frankiales bacterium]
MTVKDKGFVRRHLHGASATLTAVFATLLIGWAGIAPAQAATAPKPIKHMPTVVSLTFDDGTPDQVATDGMLTRYGMRGTYYVNSGRLGAAGYMSTNDALALQSHGHEIAGHTVSHADLPTLGDDEAKRQVCNDRANLLRSGLNASNFAYPFGDQNATIQRIVADCGYNSARGVGDIVSPGTCSGCRYAETIPPLSAYDLATPDSIKDYTTLTDMQNYVLQAEQHSGGWVVLVMHHVCSGCNPYSVAPSQLDSFLSWLAARSAGGTTVRTVAQVIGGTLKPAVDGPPPPAPLSNTNLLRNPSMEQIGSSGIPTCWQRGGYGTNSFAWANTTDAQDGVNAQRVSVTSFTDGDRRILTPQDLGACAPPTVVGHTYQVRGWYKTDGSVRLVAYYRTPNGGWVFFAQGPLLAAAPSAYAQTVWTTPAMPAGSTALSIGLSIRSTGFLQGDNLSLNDSDQVAPAVDLTSPPDGARVRGTVTFTAEASDASGVHHVDFLVNGNTACTDSSAPYTCAYNTTTLPDSVIAVTARAVDTANNEGLSDGQNNTVSNSVPLDTQNPTVTVTAPANGGTVHGTTATLAATASDDDAVNQVLFYVNGIEVGATNVAPYEIPWDSTTVPDGPITVTSKAIDLSGNVGTSAGVSATVDNNTQDSTPPVSTIACNGGACDTTGWYRTAVNVTLAATDVGSGVSRIVYTTDGSDPTGTNGTTYTTGVSLTASATVKYRAYDVAGNAEAVHTAALNIDTAAPTASITSPANGSTVTGSTYIVAAASDNVSVARVWFYLDGKALGSRIVTPFQWKWDTTPVTKGSHSLYIVVLDPAGNQTQSAPVTVTVA